MQEFFNNRYVRLTSLTVGLAVLFYLVIWIIFSIIGMNDFPPVIQAVFAVLGAGLLVNKLFANRIF